MSSRPLPEGSAAAHLREPTRRELKERHILAVLLEQRHDVRQAALRLGISRSALYRKLRAMGVAPSRRPRRGRR